MEQSVYPEFQKYGRIGLERLHRFLDTGRINKTRRERLLGKGGVDAVNYLIGLSKNKSAALTLARKIQKEGSYRKNSKNYFNRRLDQLERWERKERGEGDPFWNNGTKLFPAESGEVWALTGALLIDDILWLIARHKGGRPLNNKMELISVDTRTGESRTWSTFDASEPGRNVCLLYSLDFLGNGRLAQMGDSFYYASQNYGIIRFPLANEPASCIDMKAGMPANNCENLVAHQGWIIASFRDESTALVAWHPKSGEIKMLMHPSKPSLMDTSKAPVIICGLASDITRDCVWVATRPDASSYSGWRNHRRISGVFQVQVAPWKILPATFPRYTGSDSKASSVEATESSLWFNRSGRYGRWLSYDFSTQTLSYPASKWIENDPSYEGGPYVTSGHYFFFNRVDYVDTRNGRIHAISQAPGLERFDPYPVFLDANRLGAVIIMYYWPNSYEVWLIDTTKELGI